MKKFIQSYSLDSDCPERLVAEGLIESNNIIRIVGPYLDEDKRVYYKVKLTEKKDNGPLLGTFIGFLTIALFFALMAFVGLASNASEIGTTVILKLAYISAAISAGLLFLLIPYGKVNIWAYIREADYKELTQ